MYKSKYKIEVKYLKSFSKIDTYVKIINIKTLYLINFKSIYTHIYTSF